MSKPVEFYVPYQRCPICEGQGIVAKPATVPAGVTTWSSTQAVHTCHLCKGEKVISMHRVVVPVEAQNKPETRQFARPGYSSVWFLGQEYPTQIDGNGRERFLTGENDESTPVALASLFVAYKEGSLPIDNYAKSIMATGILVRDFFDLSPFKPFAPTCRTPTKTHHDNQ